MELDKILKDLLEDVEDIFASKKAVNIYVYDASLETIRDLVAKGYRLGSVQGSGSGVRALASKNIQTEEFEISATVYSENITMEKYMELRKTVKE